MKEIDKLQKNSISLILIAKTGHLPRWDCFLAYQVRNI